MKKSDMNHLRRLLGWIRCEIGLPPAEQQRTMISIAEKLGECGIDADAKARLVEGYRRAEAVPVYVRDAVNALEKSLPAPGRGPGAEVPRATAETRVSIGFDPGAAAGREPEHFEWRREIDSAGARRIFEAGFGSPRATQEGGLVTDMTARVIHALRPFVEGFEGVRGHAEAAALLHELMATPSALAAPEASEAVRDAGIAASEDVELPPLPPADLKADPGGDAWPFPKVAYFNAASMTAYARAALSAQTDAQEGETC
ncbi:hypothetical protein [Achromobacter mucicolens]|uniref:hypothetical protein n=1 Tax=Achromobacter mucicolens TaxID=1389922 RepID=UPI002899D2F0|nr:hypothetical protein [Achromobacter mucicolens]